MLNKAEIQSRTREKWNILFEPYNKSRVTINNCIQFSDSEEEEEISFAGNYFLNQLFLID
jgi:hypothetical protein